NLAAQIDDLATRHHGLGEVVVEPLLGIGVARIELAETLDRHVASPCGILCTGAPASLSWPHSVRPSRPFRARIKAWMAGPSPAMTRAYRLAGLPQRPFLVTAVPSRHRSRVLHILLLAITNVQARSTRHQGSRDMSNAIARVGFAAEIAA